MVVHLKLNIRNVALTESSSVTEECGSYEIFLLEEKKLRKVEFGRSSVRKSFKVG